MQFDDHIRHIHPDVLVQRMREEDLDIIDIREPRELRELPFEGARNIPTNLLVMFHDEFLTKDRTYFILCHHGQRSYRVTELLQNMGYRVINVFGGIDLVSPV